MVQNCKTMLTPTWFEHAAFWSGVRRATIAPRSQSGSTEIWTRIAGFRVLSANHYTIEPEDISGRKDGRVLDVILHQIWKQIFLQDRVVTENRTWTTRFGVLCATHYTIASNIYLYLRNGCLRPVEFSRNLMGFRKVRFYRDLNSDRRIQSPEC